MLAENLIVIVIDGLQTGYLAPYGNAWVPTPTWCELASQSLLLEWNYVDSSDLASTYQAYWSGLPAISSGGWRTADRLMRRLDEAGIKAFCVTDRREIGDWGMRHARYSLVETADMGDVGARTDSWEETSAARWAMMAAEIPARAPSRFFTWIHCDALARQWQAPLAWRERFRDEEDPPPPTFLDPPQGRIDSDADPDELLDYSHAYAAELMLCDAYLSLILEAIQQSKQADSTAILVTAPRGYALGDHRWLGIDVPALYGELLHTPALLRLPDGQHRLERRTGIFQACDLYATCLEVLGIANDSHWSRSWCSAEPAPDRAVAVSDAGRCLRTPAWLASWHNGQPFELYVKPDDRWEANDVAARRRDVEDLAQQALDDFLAAAQVGKRDACGPLAQGLREV